MSRNNEIAVFPNTAPRSVTTDDKTQQAFKIDEIPLFLFEELARLLGIGEETSIKLGSFTYRVRQLNPEHQVTGFEYWIGYHVHYDKKATFSLWSQFPSSDPDQFQPIIAQIIAGPERSGTWSAGSGNEIFHTIHMEYGCDGNIWLRRAEIPFLALLMFRVAEIYRRPECVSERYWERSKF